LLIKNFQLELLESFSIMPQRLLFAEQDNTGEQNENKNQDDNSENFTLKSDWKEHENFEEYKKHINKAVQFGKLDKNKKESLLKNAEREFQKKEDQEKKQNESQELLERMEQLQKSREVEKRTEKRLDAGFIEDYRQMREFIRGEIESLGIPFKKESDDKKWFKDFIKFEQQIADRVLSILENTKKHTSIVEEAKRDQEQSQRCWGKLRAIFEDRNKKIFLDFLASRNIPASDKFKIEKIIEMGNSIPDLSNFDSFLNVVDHLQLFQLEDALNSITWLYERWRDAPDESITVLKRDLLQYEKKLKKYKETLSTIDTDDLATKRILENEHIRVGRRTKDIEQYEKLLKENNDPGTRRLIKTFLNGAEGNLKKHQNDLERLVISSITDEPEKAADDYKKEESQEPEYKDNLHNRQYGTGNMANFNKKLVKFFTANQKIVWYSFNDISESFALVKNALSKHMESVSEDKRAPLAEKMASLRTDIQERINHIDISEERQRADDLKKTYKNYDRKRLISELSQPPAKDRRRAILETLAERGNMNMSDPELINIVCPGRFNKKNWDKALDESDFTEMREAFKKYIDAENGFIGEINYGQELIDKQNSGYSSANDSGEKLVGASQTISVSAEYRVFEEQGKVSQTEGEGKVFGMVKTAIARANTYSGNGAKVKAHLKIDHKDDTAIDAEANMGLYGLKITDLFLKGEVSRELIIDISKKNESGFSSYSAFADTLGYRKGNKNNKKVCMFEQWGWVEEGEWGQGTITALGAKEIINFFNTRNAKTEDGTVVHIAIDSDTYRRHSRRHSSVSDAVNQSIKVGDKLTSYLAKNFMIDVFDNATKKKAGGTGAMVGEIDQIASLIKAGVEDFCDGAEMMQDGERYYDTFDGLECNQDGSKKKDKDGNWTDEKHKGEIKKYGADRMNRGKDILVRIMQNMYNFSEDRMILQSNTQYHGETLNVFLKKQLDKYQKEHAFAYKQIMSSFGKLNDSEQVLSREEIEHNQKTKGAKSTDDYDYAATA
jgi:hypothetical protein